MLSTATGLMIVSTCGIAVAAQIRCRAPLISFLTLVNAIFLTAVLPKALLYHDNGLAVFLTASAPISEVHVNAAVIVACLFVAGVNFGWQLYSPLAAIMPVVAWPKWGHGRARDALERLDAFAAFVALPAALLATGVLAYEIHVSGGHLMQKLASYPTDDTQLVYLAQKAAQGAKCVFYLYLIKLAADGWALSPRANLLFFLSIGLTIFAFVAVGQRSGVFLLLLQSAFLLQARKHLSLRAILIGLSAFLIISVMVVMIRDTSENTGFVFVNLMRRYFFEIEKLAGIAMVVEASGAAIGSVWDLLIQVSHVDVPPGSLHEYVGHEVLGSKSAVPPTIVGESFLLLGAASVFPLGLLIGTCASAMERLLYNAKSPVLQVLAATILALAAYLFLNTGTLSFFNRLLLELVLISAGWFGLMLFNFARNITRQFPQDEGR